MPTSRSSPRRRAQRGVSAGVETESSRQRASTSPGLWIHARSKRLDKAQGRRADGEKEDELKCSLRGGTVGKNATFVISRADGQ